MLWDLPDDAPHYAAVGRIAAAWASFESTLDREIYLLLGGATAMQAACVTAQMMGAAPRIKAIRALCELQGASETLIAKLNEFLNKTYSVAEKRNRIVHDPYVFDRSDGQVSQFRVTAQKELEYGYKPITLPEMATILTQIRAHHERFFLVIRKGIYDEIRAPRAEQLQQQAATQQDQAG
jgi:hypothetical protein